MNSDNSTARHEAFEIAQKMIAPGVHTRLDSGFKIVAGFPTGEIIESKIRTASNGVTAILLAQEAGLHYGGDNEWSPAHERVVEARVDAPLFVDADPKQIMLPVYEDSRLLLRVNLISESEDRWQDLIRDVVVVVDSHKDLEVGTVSLPYGIKDLRRLIIEEIEVRRDRGDLFTGCQQVWHEGGTEAEDESDYFDITMTGCCRRCASAMRSFNEAIPRVSDYR